MQGTTAGSGQASTDQLTCLHAGLGERYTIERELGRGGMGTVYLAHDHKYDRAVAVKVLRPELAAVIGTERFLQEIQTVARLAHPHIMPLYDSGDADGLLYYVMPYVEGEALRARLGREKQLSLDDALQIAREVADALSYAHGHNVLHRDIRPENILLESGHAVVADFGIARAITAAGGRRLTPTGIALGTPEYMSPEQAAADPDLDGRSDLYSLGCVVFEMLAGQPPFTGRTHESVVHQHWGAAVPSLTTLRAGVPAHVAAAVTRTLAKTPAERFPSAAAFAEALGQRESATLPTTARQARRRVLRGVAAVVAVGGAFLMLWPGRDALVSRVPRGKGTAVRPQVVVALLENRTGEASYDALSFMATDWVTEGLERTTAVDIVPTPTAVAATRVIWERPQAGDPVRALALETGANLVVTGAIYRDHDSLMIQAQLANAEAGRLLGVVEPVRTGIAQSTGALQTLRERIMGLLALSLDERVIGSERPPTYAAYEAFGEGVDAYVRQDYIPALAAFERSHALDTGFVLPLLYAAFSHMNRYEYALADSVLLILARDRGRLSELDRDWLDYQRAQLAGNRPAALAAIRRAAELTPSSKASYNFAVTAYEGREPFAAESALERLSPDVGPMRGWLPYWEMRTWALHAEERYGEELKVARETRRRFPDQSAAYVSEARALAARHETNELDLLWSAARDKFDATPVELGNVAYEAGSELWAHGESDDSRAWFSRAYDAFAASTNPASALEARWGEAQAAARLGRLDEALHLSGTLAAHDPIQHAEFVGFHGVLAAQAGYGARARELLDQLAADTQPYSFGAPQFEAGRIAVALGDVDRARELLASASVRDYPYEVEFHRDPILLPLRGSPIWEQLEARRR